MLLFYEILEECNLPYEVSLKQIPPMNVVSIRANTSMESMAEDMGERYGELWAYLQEVGGSCTGVSAVYHDQEFDPENIDVECCFSVEEALPERGRIVSRLLEGGPMASTTHKGPYDELGAAYEAVAKWIEENGYAYAGPMRDIYLNDPEEVSPEELLTETLFPVSKKN